MKKYLIYLLIAIPVFGMTACEDYTTIENIDLGSAGNFTVINMGTNDTIVVDGAINTGSTSTTLAAHNSNIIKIMFEPAEKFEKYNFSTTYVLHDSTIIKNEPVYDKYVIENTEPGTYRISMSASYVDDNNTLYSGGSLNLVVRE